MKRIILCSAIFLSLHACKNKTAAVKAEDKKESSATPSQQETKSTTSATPAEPSDGISSPEPGTTGTWGEIEKAAFVRECTKAAISMGESKAKDYCTCMLGKMQAKFPDIRDANKITQNETVALAKECLK